MLWLLKRPWSECTAVKHNSGSSIEQMQQSDFFLSSKYLQVKKIQDLINPFGGAHQSTNYFLPFHAGISTYVAQCTATKIY